MHLRSVVRTLVACLLLVASACGSSGVVEGAAPAEVVVADAGTAIESGEPSMAGSTPIGAFMLDAGGLEAALADYIVLVEEQIAVCMAAQGFEFARSPTRTTELVERSRELTVREWTQEYGYGISTDSTSFDPRESRDPNTPITMSLSAAEREQWRLALTGGEFDVGPSGMDQRPLSEQGCIGQGFIQTGGSDAFEGLQQLGLEYDDLEQILAERREVVEAIDAWSRCMSQAGYPDFGALDDPEDRMRDRLYSLQRSVFATLPDVSDEERRAWFDGEWEGDDPEFGASELQDLQAEEIALAVADLDCYENEAKAIYEPLRNELENGLLDRYGSDIELFRDLVDK